MPAGLRSSARWPRRWRRCQAVTAAAAAVPGGYHRAFHDITTGNNTVTYPGGAVTGYRAGPGWDPVTGWGTPDAQVLVPLPAAGG